MKCKNSECSRISGHFLDSGHNGDSQSTWFNADHFTLKNHTSK